MPSDVLLERRCFRERLTADLTDERLMVRVRLQVTHDLIFT